jgi:hypothetical protein
LLDPASGFPPIATFQSMVEPSSLAVAGMAADRRNSRVSSPARSLVTVTATSTLTPRTQDMPKL